MQVMKVRSKSRHAAIQRGVGFRAEAAHPSCRASLLQCTGLVKKWKGSAEVIGAHEVCWHSAGNTAEEESNAPQLLAWQL